MKFISMQRLPAIASGIVLLVLFICGSLLFDNFATWQVVINLFGDNAFLGVVAIGSTLVILSGGIDLSVGSVVACTSIAMAVLISKGWHPLFAILIVLCGGMVFGASMGVLIHKFKLPPFLVTLGGMFFARGLGFIFQSQSMMIDHPFYIHYVQDKWIINIGHTVSIPFAASVFIVVVILGTLLVRYTSFGRYVQAIGSNEQSARMMGLPVGRTKILVYTMASLLAAGGGVVATFYMQSGNPASFVGLELDAIAATVIGGTLLRGGVGFVPGTMIGVLILGIIQTLITFQGTLNSWWTRIVVGALLFLFILLQQLITNRSTRSVRA